MQTHAGSVFASSFCELLWACLHGLCGSCFAGVLQLLWFLQSFLPLFKEISWSLNGETQWRPLCFMPSSCLAVCLCTRFHLLPEGASQLTITQEADMWMYQSIYRSHFIGLFFSSHVCFFPRTLDLACLWFLVIWAVYGVGSLSHCGPQAKPVLTPPILLCRHWPCTSCRQNRL